MSKTPYYCSAKQNSLNLQNHTPPMGALQGNLANIEPTPEQIAALDGAFTTIAEIFTQWGIEVMTAEEFSDFDKVDEERYGFMTTVLEDIKVEGRAIPDNVNVAALSVDEKAQAFLAPREGKLQNLLNLMRSARVMVTWDLLVDVSRIYRYVRYKAKEGDSWAVTLYDKWKVHYEKTSKNGPLPNS